MNSEYLRGLGVGTILGGEFEGELVKLAERIGMTAQAGDFISAQAEKEISLERLEFLVPDRGGMPGIEKYAHLVLPDGSHRVVGSTEASRGCKHLCRHCPIVPVYDGVFRIVQRDVVMADVRQQVAAGARHISFGDPDFFNGIKHALTLMEEFHREFSDVTYDVTIKIEHLRKYEKELSTLRATGCLFVISAVEAVDDGILARLDKGHTREDFVFVARAFRDLGMTLHPTFVAFTPWTTLEGYLDLLRVIAVEGLVENVAPVQLGIRLLIPEGSRLLELAETRELVGAFDAESLVYPWRNVDARVDRLSDAVQAIAADADAKKLSRAEAFARIWEAAHAAAGVAAPSLDLGAGRAVPFLSEPWYCCAEPTKAQLVSIGAVASNAKPAASTAGERVGISADGFV
jgi:Radical SAM superfamily